MHSTQDIIKITLFKQFSSFSCWNMNKYHLILSYCHEDILQPQ